MTDIIIYTPEQAANVFAGRAFDDCGCDELTADGVQTFDVQQVAVADGPVCAALDGLLSALSGGGVTVDAASEAEAKSFAAQLDSAVVASDWDGVAQLAGSFYDATGALYFDFLEATGTVAYVDATTAYTALEAAVQAAAEQADEAMEAPAGEEVDPDEIDGLDDSLPDDPDGGPGDEDGEVIYDDGLTADTPPEDVPAPVDVDDSNASLDDLVGDPGEDLLEDVMPTSDQVAEVAEEMIEAGLLDPGATIELPDGSLVDTQGETIEEAPADAEIPPTEGQEVVPTPDAGEDDELDEDALPPAYALGRALEQFKAGSGKNWVQQTGGLPHYIKRIAKHLVERGMTQSHAIAAAVNTVKRWARGGQGVKADTVAKSLAALAEWEAKKALAHATAGVTSSWSVDAWERFIELGEFSALPDGSFPLNSLTDLKNAIQANGRAKDKAKARAHIISAAKELGHSELIPDSWSLVDGQILAVNGSGEVLVNALDAVASQVLTVSNDVREAVGLIAEGTRAAEGHVLADDVNILELLAADLTASARPVAATSLVASGGALTAPIKPPKEWFADPKFRAVTPIKVDDDGRIYGHLASWDACHMESAGLGSSCVKAPRSRNGYAMFHTGYVTTADGTDIPTGRIVAGAPHADPIWGLNSTLVHYSHSGWVGADVRVGEDKYGVWVAGAVRPDVTPTQLRALKAAPLSGDWRTDPKSGRLELVTALGVTVPGLPIPRLQALVASAGNVTSMQSVGMVPPKQIILDKGEPILGREDLAYLKERSAASKSWALDADRINAAWRAGVLEQASNFARERMLSEMVAVVAAVR